MRFAFITHPIIKHEETKEESIELGIARLNAGPGEAIISLNFHRDAKGDWTFSSMDTQSMHASEVATVADVMNGFTRFLGKTKHGLGDPDALLVELERAGSRHCVYDPRVKRYVAIDKLKPAGQAPFVAKGKGGAVLAEAMADNEERALDLLTRAVTKLMVDEPAKALSASEWFAGGRKILKGETENGAPPVVNDVKAYTKRNAGKGKTSSPA